jgi:hypothetical protein
MKRYGMIFRVYSKRSRLSFQSELTLWSLSNIREGRNGFPSASPSLILEKGMREDEFGKGFSL